MAQGNYILLEITGIEGDSKVPEGLKLIQVYGVSYGVMKQFAHVNRRGRIDFSSINLQIKVGPWSALLTDRLYSGQTLGTVKLKHVRTNPVTAAGASERIIQKTMTLTDCRVESASYSFSGGMGSSTASQSLTLNANKIDIEIVKTEDAAGAETYPKVVTSWDRPTATGT